MYYGSYDIGISAQTDDASSRRCRFQKSIAKGPPSKKTGENGQAGREVPYSRLPRGRERERESFRLPQLQGTRHKTPGTRHHDKYYPLLDTC